MENEWGEKVVCYGVCPTGGSNDPACPSFDCMLLQFILMLNIILNTPKLGSERTF